MKTCCWNHTIFATAISLAYSENKKRFITLRKGEYGYWVVQKRLNYCQWNSETDLHKYRRFSLIKYCICKIAKTNKVEVIHFSRKPLFYIYQSSASTKCKLLVCSLVVVERKKFKFCLRWSSKQFYKFMIQIQIIASKEFDGRLLSQKTI